MDNSGDAPEVRATDGGPKVNREDSPHDWNSTPVYVVCGAIAGGALGVAGGPAGVIGLAVLGAMLGNEYAQRSP